MTTGETPPDPYLFSASDSENDIDELLARYEGLSIEEALSLGPEIKELTPSIDEIIPGEGRKLISTLRSYGLSDRLADKADRLIHEEGRLIVNFSNEHAPINKGIEVVTTPDSVDVIVGARTLRTFISDALHSIGPVGGDDEICFARDTGVKMIYSCALLLGLLEVNGITENKATRTSESLRNLMLIGKNPEFEEALTTRQYMGLFPYRLAARLAIERLHAISTEFFDGNSINGDQVVKRYDHLRRQSLNAIREGSVSDGTFMDIATAMPLSEDNTVEFMSNLQATMKQNGYI